MDIVISSVPFPLMKWNYSSCHQQAIQNYSLILWERNFKFHFYDIYNYVMIPLHEVIFGKTPPRVSQDIKEALVQIGVWFIDELFNYIRVYGSEVGPHSFPRYILERISIREIKNQTALHGQARKLSRLPKENLA
jgi:hypothetical protein